jgi:hypothetical protein
MRVDPRVGMMPVANGQASRAKGTSGFSLDETDKARDSRKAATIGAPMGLDAILALQSNDERPQERKRRALKRGHDLLDALDRLKITLLSNRLSLTDLVTIRQTLSQRGADSGDPALDDLIGQIELRAEVEIAKLAARNV